MRSLLRLRKRQSAKVRKASRLQSHRGAARDERGSNLVNVREIAAVPLRPVDPQAAAGPVILNPSAELAAGLYTGAISAPSTQGSEYFQLAAFVIERRRAVMLLEL